MNRTCESHQSLEIVYWRFYIKNDLDRTSWISHFIYHTERAGLHLNIHASDKLSPRANRLTMYKNVYEKQERAQGLSTEMELNSSLGLYFMYKVDPRDTEAFLYNDM